MYIPNNANLFSSEHGIFTKSLRRAVKMQIKASPPFRIQVAGQFENQKVSKMIQTHCAVEEL